MDLDVVSEMPGMVWKVDAVVGEPAAPSLALLVLESMKMEIPVHPEVEGVVHAVLVREGDFVRAGDVLVRLGVVATSAVPTDSTSAPPRVS